MTLEDCFRAAGYVPGSDRRNLVIPATMIDDAVLKSRYPDPPPPPAAWVGWRRDRKKGGLWEQVEGSEKPTKGEAYQALMSLSELVGGEPVEWEYTIRPKGERPFDSGRRRFQ